MKIWKELQDAFLQTWHSEITTNRNAMAALFVLGVFVYGLLAFNPTLTADSWWRLFEPGHPSGYGAGRWFKPILWNVTFDHLFSPGASLLAGLGLCTVATCSMARRLRVAGTISVTIFGALIIFSPVIAMHFSHYSHHIPTGVAFAFIALALLLIERDFNSEKFDRNVVSHLKFLLPALLLVILVAGIRQSFFLFFLVLLTGMFLLNLQRGSTYRGYHYLTALVFSGLAIVGYFLAWKGVLALVDHEAITRGPYAIKSDPVDIVKRLPDQVSAMLKYIGMYLTADQILWPRYVKVLFLLAGGVAAGGGVRLAIKRGAPLFLLSNCLLAVAIVLIPWGIYLIHGHEIAVRYTALAGLAPIYAVVLALITQVPLKSYLRGSALVLMAVIAISFAFHINAAITSTHFQNQRDKFFAQSLLSRIYADDKAAEFYSAPGPKTITLLGKFDITQNCCQKDPLDLSKPAFLSGIGLIDGIFDSPYEIRTKALFKLITFRDNESYVIEKPNPRQLKSLCQGVSPKQRDTQLLKWMKKRQKWPHPESVHIRANRVYVKIKDVC